MNILLSSGRRKGVFPRLVILFITSIMTIGITNGKIWRKCFVPTIANIIKKKLQFLMEHIAGIGVVVDVMNARHFIPLNTKNIDSRKKLVYD